jgi:U3 small nucleolar RNA-associated protein 14
LEKREEHVLPGSGGWGNGGVGGEVAQTIYTHVNKCKNDKLKGENKQTKHMPQNDPTQG